MPLSPLPHPVTKVLVLTDLHLRGGGQTIIGLDPTARLFAAYSAAVTAHPDAAALVLMGDLTHSGTAEEYALLREMFEGCPVPVIYMLGNHDHRATFRASFPEVAVSEGGHVQRILDLPQHRLITLDSSGENLEPRHGGWLCAARMAWLEEALAGCDGRMPLVFIHHPPHCVGLPGMDDIRLINGDALLERLRGTGAHLFCGHVHRTISGQAGGVAFTMFKSPCHQAPLDLVEADSTLSVDEPGAYGLLLLSQAGVVAHSEDVGLGAVAHKGAEALPDGDRL